MSFHRGHHRRARTADINPLQGASRNWRLAAENGDKISDRRESGENTWNDSQAAIGWSWHGSGLLSLHGGRLILRLPYSRTWQLVNRVDAMLRHVDLSVGALAPCALTLALPIHRI